MNCWHCGTILTIDRKIPFRATCDQCGAALHCCQNCKYYQPGRPNDCAVPGTEFVSDRQAINFCEEFSLLGKPPAPKDPKITKRFDDLFR